MVRRRSLFRLDENVLQKAIFSRNVALRPSQERLEREKSVCVCVGKSLGLKGPR